MKFDDFEADNGAIVLNLSGKIMGGEETTMFHGKLHEYIRAGKKQFVIDLKNVEFGRAGYVDFGPYDCQRCRRSAGPG